MLRAARRSAVEARTQAANLFHALLVTAPDDLRSRAGTGSLRHKADTCAGLRPGTDPTDATTATKTAQRAAARRWQHLDQEIRQLTKDLDAVTTRVAPQLREQLGVGPDVAAALLIAAGGNPERLTGEAAFAALCGVSPIPASSGNTRRHRLSRGGDRQANAALHAVCLTRMSHDPATHD